MNANTNKKEKRPGRGARRFVRVFVTVGIVIILIHLTAPYFILKYLNKRMANMPDYVGHIDKLRINLFTASVTVKGLSLKKKEGKIPVPFISATKIKSGIDWSALFKGRIVGQVHIENLAINFVKGPTKETSQTKIDKSWMDMVKDISPIELNLFELINGEVHYRDFHSKSKIDVFLNNIYITARNLSNVNDKNELLPASVVLQANGYGSKLYVNVKLNALSKVPTFDVNTDLKEFPLTKINDVLKSYANFNVEKGTFSIYAEAAARDGKINGYAKPFIKDLTVKKEKDEPFSQKAWASFLQFVTWLLENEDTEQIATKVNLEGKIKNPDVSIWGVIGETLSNAFVKSLIPMLENSVNINTVDKKPKKNILKKVFGKKDKDKDKKEEKKK